MYITITPGSLKDKKRRNDIVRLLHELIALEDGEIDRVGGASEETPQKHKLLRREQVTELVPVSRATLHRMVVDGKFPAPKRVGGQLAWRASEVFKWIESEDEDDHKRSEDGRTKNFKREAKELSKRNGHKKPIAKRVKRASKKASKKV
jgi:prophage regulatory protein